ncbi:putative niacin/nicotinamide transporter NaiP [Lactobacillus helveticus]|uniref:Niacin/nicotinamide transporter NaiP n=1 Tax=Lactobacillus helveticus TaxID=1587 RepID=A0A9Q5C0J3_LACHE|nr:MFS transporter [Lactobacillus helveticus]NRN79348.1 putative niacin/nicotinamide transporter NaiP [Lactobacillus helveticus]NRN91741.1 putative niacin/nicotinamide transporter NaiP [Lactobacillus helveticus]NRN95865.1 putative niacin/nicotinamide transporter NaiP [Lactobacillus helveticus]NRO14648.1 putative niacin/nicotinamide transporter NaiP [Lactobacillus helveticus]NRO52915.1 putative niacin/nicotinamide transporter NaiP [Lactobacillus helveticus]
MDIIDTHSHGLSKNQKWVIASTSSGFALENMDVLFLSFAMSSMIADLHLSGGAAGLISSITNLGMLFGGICFGILGDKIGRVKTFSHTVLIFAIATALMAFANNIYEIYALRFLAGIGAGGEYGVGIALIAENFKSHQIGKMTSIAAVGGQIGAIIAALVAAWIIPHLGWHMLFLVGIVPVVLTVFIRKHLHESDQFLAAKNNEKGSLLTDVVKKMFSTPRLALQSLGLMVMMTVQIAGYFGLMNWLPTIVQKQLNLNVSSSSLWMIATIIGMCVGMMTFGSIFDYFGPRRAFAIFLIGSAVMVYVLALAQNMASLLVIGAVMGFFSNGMFGGYGAVISRLYPTEIRSSANNIIVNVGRAIGGFSSVVIGILMDHYSLTVVMGFLSALYIISFVVMISLPGLKRLTVKH